MINFGVDLGACFVVASFEVGVGVVVVVVTMSAVVDSCSSIFFDAFSLISLSLLVLFSSVDDKCRCCSFLLAIRVLHTCLLFLLPTFNLCCLERFTNFVFLLIRILRDSFGVSKVESGEETDDDVTLIYDDLKAAGNDRGGGGGVVAAWERERRKGETSVNICCLSFWRL